MVRGWTDGTCADSERLNSYNFPRYCLDTVVVWDVSVITTPRNLSLCEYGKKDLNCMLSKLIVLDGETGPKVAYAGKFRCQVCDKSEVNLIKESLSGEMLCIDCIIQKSRSFNTKKSS